MTCHIQPSISLLFRFGGNQQQYRKGTLFAITENCLIRFYRVGVQVCCKPSKNCGKSPQVTPFRSLSRSDMKHEVSSCPVYIYIYIHVTMGHYLVKYTVGKNLNTKMNMNTNVHIYTICIHIMYAYCSIFYTCLTYLLILYHIPLK